MSITIPFYDLNIVLQKRKTEESVQPHRLGNVRPWLHEFFPEVKIEGREFFYVSLINTTIQMIMGYLHRDKVKLQHILFISACYMLDTGNLK